MVWHRQKEIHNAAPALKPEQQELFWYSVCPVSSSQSAKAEDTKCLRLNQLG